MSFPLCFFGTAIYFFNRTNSAELVGKTAVYRGNPSPCSCASYLIRARLKPAYVPEFLAYYINSTFGRAWIASVVSQQVGQANVNGTKLKALRLPVPHVDEQRRIVAEIEKQFTRLEAGVAALRRVQANLKRYRAAVLKAACEGRLVPTEAELAKAENRKFETGEELLARILTERRQRPARPRQNKKKYVEPPSPNRSFPRSRKGGRRQLASSARIRRRCSGRNLSRKDSRTPECRYSRINAVSRTAAFTVEKAEFVSENRSK